MFHKFCCRTYHFQIQRSSNVYFRSFDVKTELSVKFNVEQMFVCIFAVNEFELIIYYVYIEKCYLHVTDVSKDNEWVLSIFQV